MSRAGQGLGTGVSVVGRVEGREGRPQRTMKQTYCVVSFRIVEGRKVNVDRFHSFREINVLLFQIIVSCRLTHLEELLFYDSLQNEKHMFM